MRKLLVAFFVVMLSCVGASAQMNAAMIDKFKAEVKAAKAEVGVIALDKVKAMMDEGETFTIVDVRDSDEITSFGRPKWSAYKNISRGKLEPILGKSGLSVDEKIVVFCKTGARAALAAQTMKAYGFKNVMIADGGMDGWIMRDYPEVEVSAQCK
jgi:rhodanese-related sulfurtransferase